ncbi:MAG: hypothetical protein WCI05_02210 [Myxococcales bacterium]
MGPDSPISPRLRRVLELVYGVEGVTGARVWQWENCVAVGVRGGVATSPSELLARVSNVLVPLQQPDEQWEIGLLVDET